MHQIWWYSVVWSQLTIGNDLLTKLGVGFSEIIKLFHEVKNELDVLPECNLGDIVQQNTSFIYGVIEQWKKQIREIKQKKDDKNETYNKIVDIFESASLALSTNDMHLVHYEDKHINSTKALWWINNLKEWSVTLV